MKRGYFFKSVGVLLLLLVGSAGIFAEREDEVSLRASALNRLIDFELDLKGLVRLVRDREFDPTSLNKFVWVDGSVADITILELAKNQLLVEVSIIQGEWIGTQEVTLYRGYLYLEGPKFASFISTLKAHDYIQAIGSLEEVYEDETGQRYPVILALHVRKLP